MRKAYVPFFVVLCVALGGACAHVRTETANTKSSGLTSQKRVNESLALDYNHDVQMAGIVSSNQVQNKTLDYQFMSQQSLVNYELNLKQAWEACIDKNGEDGPSICREIYGGWPYYMSYMGMGYGYGGYGAQMAYPGCPYADITWCDTWSKTQQGMMLQSAVSQYAQAAPGVWVADSANPDYEEQKAELEAMREELLEMIGELKPILEKVAE